MYSNDKFVAVESINLKLLKSFMQSHYKKSVKQDWKKRMRNQLSSNDMFHLHIPNKICLNDHHVNSFSVLQLLFWSKPYLCFLLNGRTKSCFLVCSNWSCLIFVHYSNEIFAWHQNKTISMLIFGSREWASN